MEENNRRMVVQITGSRNKPSITNSRKDISDIKIPEDRRDLISEKLFIKLCLKKDLYTNNIKYIQICDAIQWICIDKYFKNDKPYTDEIKDLLFYDILLSLKRGNIEVTDEGALYNLLTL